MVADAGMLSEANLAAIEDAGLRFIVGARIPEVPYQVSQWRRRHPGEPIGDGQVFTQPWTMGSKAGRHLREGRRRAGSRRLPTSHSSMCLPCQRRFVRGKSLR